MNLKRIAVILVTSQLVAGGVSTPKAAEKVEAAVTKQPLITDQLKSVRLLVGEVTVNEIKVFFNDLMIGDYVAIRDKKGVVTRGGYDGIREQWKDAVWISTKQGPRLIYWSQIAALAVEH